ncbi:MAG: twin-arginine translocase TatA/TatE family subunit [Candidatus Omnitrophica bacterium]|nr:twin-arginine translocase TatA/TatE family subunit [Candidatus Omnitrophota bacterium]
MGRIGFGELVVILLVVLLFFGPQKLPELARALGKAIQEFKSAMNEPKNVNDDKKESEKKV